MYVGKDFEGPVPLHLKIAAGLTTGAFAITVASPTDLVKARAPPALACLPACLPACLARPRAQPAARRARIFLLRPGQHVG